MHDREPTIMEVLLERLLATRARRDREARQSEPWRAADAEMHAIERAIFGLPNEAARAGGGDALGVELPTAHRPDLARHAGLRAPPRPRARNASGRRGQRSPSAPSSGNRRSAGRID